MGKVHGSLARAGKVKSQTPKVRKTLGLFCPRAIYGVLPPYIVLSQNFQRWNLCILQVSTMSQPYPMTACVMNTNTLMK